MSISFYVMSKLLTVLITTFRHFTYCLFYIYFLPFSTLFFGHAFWSHFLFFKVFVDGRLTMCHIYDVLPFLTDISRHMFLFFFPVIICITRSKLLVPPFFSFFSNFSISFFLLLYPLWESPHMLEGMVFYVASLSLCDLLSCN